MKTQYAYMFLKQTRNENNIWYLFVGQDDKARWSASLLLLFITSSPSRMRAAIYPDLFSFGLDTKFFMCAQLVIHAEKAIVGHQQT